MDKLSSRARHIKNALRARVAAGGNVKYTKKTVNKLIQKQPPVQARAAPEPYRRANKRKPPFVAKVEAKAAPGRAGMYGAVGAGAAALAGGGYALRKALKSRAAKATLRKRLAIGGAAAGAGGLGAALAYRKRA